MWGVGGTLLGNIFHNLCRDIWLLGSLRTPVPICPRESQQPSQGMAIRCQICKRLRMVLRNRHQPTKHESCLPSASAPSHSVSNFPRCSSGPAWVLAPRLPSRASVWCAWGEIRTDRVRFLLPPFPCFLRVTRGDTSHRAHCLPKRAPRLGRKLSGGGLASGAWGRVAGCHRSWLRVTLEEAQGGCTCPRS